MEGYSLFVQCIVVFICQVVFVYFRTINVQHVVNGSILQNVKSSLGLNLSWIISTSIGVKSVLTGNYLLFGVYILAGLFGTIATLVKSGRRWADEERYSPQISE